ncbi:CLUMA_CG013222, isoform A [Clunio marinus]|uniref:CLUMA_CG013222, isoform A n=1 Tax=Clunio marinus TaxID=568069 RepID=A0A1J1II32_9DIPT|nr:CLUMA_CG013222, isoform A [Clunio marinus]
MTSWHNTCREISFDVAVARCFTLNGVNVSKIVKINDCVQMNVPTQTKDSGCKGFAPKFIFSDYTKSNLTTTVWLRREHRLFQVYKIRTMLRDQMFDDDSVFHHIFMLGNDYRNLS